MGSLSIWHWLIIAVVFVVFFGAKRMPDAARSLGRSLRIFKSEVSEMHSDGGSSKSDDSSKSTESSAQQPAELPASRAEEATVSEKQSESTTR